MCSDAVCEPVGRERHPSEDAHRAKRDAKVAAIGVERGSECVQRARCTLESAQGGQALAQRRDTHVAMRPHLILAHDVCGTLSRHWRRRGGRGRHQKRPWNRSRNGTRYGADGMRRVRGRCGRSICDVRRELVRRPVLKDHGCLELTDRRQPLAEVAHELDDVERVEAHLHKTRHDVHLHGAIILEALQRRDDGIERRGFGDGRCLRPLP
mmetsp:Transcript_84036/g.251923  ORF Transcript_84036/g.251923 Transcript_84036/m.251923 type:complete len:210 (+) Transcript_84036:1420-2049(+)